MRRRQAYNLSRSGYDTLDEYEMDFADPGGRSALRASSPSNPRNLPCPDCGRPRCLTPADRALGYCCDSCADRNEGGYGSCSYGDY